MTSSCTIDRSTCLKKDGDKKLVVEDSKTTTTTTNNPAIEDPCLKTSQLVTEIVLIVFAASLLLLAATIIISKEIPKVMDSYDIVPKTLFILCVIVATCSFMNWVYSKIKPQVHSNPVPNGNEKVMVRVFQETSSLKTVPAGEEHKKLISTATHSDSYSRNNLKDDLVQPNSSVIGYTTPSTSTIEEEE